MKFKRSQILVILICLAAVLFINLGTGSKPRSLPPMPREELAIVSGSGQRTMFTVEVASTPREREAGLSHRETLAEDAGMLFDFGETLPIEMWMKDTSLPLDMLFIGENGDVLSIHENAKPVSTEIIRSEAPARAVLEVAGGTAARLGVKTGDKVEHPLFAAPAPSAPSAAVENTKSAIESGGSDPAPVSEEGDGVTPEPEETQAPAAPKP